MSLSRVMFSKASDEWATPQATFDRLNAIWDFTLDPASTPENAKCAKFYTKEQDGLLYDWAGERVWLNPPYSDIKRWMRKAMQEGQKPDTVVVCLIPARTDTAYWHEYVMTVWPHGIEFLRGRLKFGGMENGAPFPSVIVTFGGTAGVQLGMLE